MRVKKELFSKPLHITFYIIAVMSLVLIIVNVTYYYSTQKALIKDQIDKMNFIAHQIKTSIELSSKGEDYFEQMMAEHLRTAAIAAKSNLDPDIDKVTNEQLVELSRKVGVDQITLFKRSGDDIVSYKSSDPLDIHTSAKSWGGDWFLALKQLMNKEQVHVSIGQTLPNFWSGPLNTSSSNLQNIDKWGYYYDGTTNYIINPFVHGTTFRQYQTQTGVDASIQQLIKNNKNSHTLEISVFNPSYMLDQAKQREKDGIIEYVTRKVLFGTYQYQDPQDKQYIREVMQTGKIASFSTTVHDKNILKTFIPVQIGKPVVIGLVSDLDEINLILKEQMNRIRLVISLCTLAIIAIVLSSIHINRRVREAAEENVENMYLENVDALFSSIREQRHDFNNHLTTIQLLVSLKHYDELKLYMKELIGEIKAINDIVNINIPVLSALIQAKITQAFEKKITFEQHFTDLKSLNINVIKTTDLVKILSNLIDNAFEAVLATDNPDKKVKVFVYIENNYLFIKVHNNGSKIEDSMKARIFEPGFSTKKGSNSHNSGLGLSIVMNTLNKHKGTITIDSTDQLTTFTAMIPL
ncbi:ATP-binding protein [Paenibacillus sediminis]|uniref:histidine kinase n=1 Tax=Paenibacillus sediminis TaxID=664909 RepID=A0ABS4H180_9BACL|nr:ATP-binding protein [Paenibacillus sediminis]MBP1936285.1 sensor histidine kinase regulating citrate/malate metabolism [Paenibacillus sediminis]